MATVCAVCSGPADQFRDMVQVVDMRVQVICRACAVESASGAASSRPRPAAMEPSAAAARRPASTAQDDVAANSAPPAGLRESNAVAEPSRCDAGAPRAAAPRATGLLVVGLAGLASVAFFAWRAAPRDATPASRRGAALASSGAGARPTSAAPRIGIAASSGDGFDVSQPAPEGIEAVVDGPWTHPLAGPYRELPHNDVQRFGAYRARDEFFKRYCGSGHCGVDIGLVVGLPVIAARDGVIDRAIYEPTELEGKYIRLAHAGGVYTYYMHLDQVAPGLRKGGEVKAGQIIGTLGHTGVKNSAAHLHFMISFESRGKEYYVDPESFLVRAKLVEIDPIPDWARPSEPAH
jgi:murein DD-endopeptidase MepM/ murein hydrolase activator NlpD